MASGALPVVRRRASDRLAVVLAWASGLLLVGAIVAIVGWLAWNGARNVSWGFLAGDPGAGSLEQGVTGGILPAIVGTLLVVLIGCLIAVPVGVATGTFLHELGRPAALARVVDTTVDVIFGIPSVVLGLFGLAVLTWPGLIPLSQEVASSGKASGTSFLCAGIVISLIAIPAVVRATQSALASVPRTRREAAYALGKSRVATLRRVVLPEARPGIATGVVLGVGRIVGDTAIIWLLLGGNVLNPPAAGWLEPQHALDTLRGQGMTLTSYVYYAAPTGEGNAESKAYGAALVLMVLMVAINAVVLVVGRRGRRAR